MGHLCLCHNLSSKSSYGKELVNNIVSTSGYSAAQHLLLCCTLTFTLLPSGPHRFLSLFPFASSLVTSLLRSLCALQQCLQKQRLGNYVCHPGAAAEAILAALTPTEVPLLRSQLRPGSLETPSFMPIAPWKTALSGHGIGSTPESQHPNGHAHAPGGTTLWVPPPDPVKR